MEFSVKIFSSNVLPLIYLHIVMLKLVDKKSTSYSTGTAIGAPIINRAYKQDDRARTVHGDKTKIFSIR